MKISQQTFRTTVLFSILTATTAFSAEPEWQQRAAEQLPLLGHRNWIVIADSAYPWQSREGIETIATGDDQLAVLRWVLEAIEKAGHIRPTIHLDAELPYVLEEEAAGISAYRQELESLLADSTKYSLPHEEIIAKLDESATTFRVLILKTNLKLPYTSVFMQLDCGYWGADAEARLRERMEDVPSGN
jgi:hypothetical protein